jgi:CHAT domain-containing protein
LINDEAATELITEFYRQLKETSVSKAKALQHAQLTLLDGRRYRYPFYWAPFLLIGNWL